MNIIKNELIFFVDIDDTLVVWGKAKRGEKVIAVTNPYDDVQEYLRPHKGHIKILKERKARGSTIIVWSAGGYRWAEAVIKALKLSDYVDLIMSKPFAYMDDKTSEHFMGERVYLGIDSTYGN